MHEILQKIAYESARYENLMGKTPNAVIIGTDHTEWLVKLKNELSTVLYYIEEKQLLEASRRMVDVTDEIAKKIGEFY